MAKICPVRTRAAQDEIEKGCATNIPARNDNLKINSYLRQNTNLDLVRIKE